MGRGFPLPFAGRPGGGMVVARCLLVRHPRFLFRDQAYVLQAGDEAWPVTPVGAHRPVSTIG